MVGLFVRISECLVIVKEARVDVASHEICLHDPFATGSTVHDTMLLLLHHFKGCHSKRYMRPWVGMTHVEAGTTELVSWRRALVVHEETRTQ